MTWAIKRVGKQFPIQTHLEPEEKETAELVSSFLFNAGKIESDTAHAYAQYCIVSLTKELAKQIAERRKGA